MAVTTALVGTAVVGGVAAKKSADAKKDAAQESAATQSAAVDAAIAQQNQGAEQSQGFLAPFQQVGQQGIDQSSFLTNPQEQFDFLQSNPLFQLALDNANQQSMQSAAASGRISAGDTLQDLSNNVLLSASPLITQQKQSISDLLTMGQNTAAQQVGVTGAQSTNIANLLTDQGAANAAGIVGAGNARAEGIEAIGGTIQNVIGAF